VASQSSKKGAGLFNPWPGYNFTGEMVKNKIGKDFKSDRIELNSVENLTTFFIWSFPNSLKFDLVVCKQT
jgi:hypothetical protein